jgi:protein involved in ribonucleotide reduction
LGSESVKIVYTSLSGNVRDFVERLGFSSIEFNPINPHFTLNEDYIFITPSYEDTMFFDDLADFIDYEDNSYHLKGIIASGNLNFDKDYCITGKALSKRFNRPLLYSFENNGTDADIVACRKVVNKYAISTTNE